MDGAAARRWLSSTYYSERINGETFDGADLTSIAPDTVSFARCTFVRADLRMGTWNQVSFRLCDLTAATLRGASLRCCHFTGCDLRGAGLRDCDLRWASFGRHHGMPDGRTDLTGARLEGAVMAHAEFIDVIGWPPD